MQIIEGALSGAELKVGIVVGRFNHLITDRLLEGALDTLRRHGVADEDITCVKVPGAFEIPAVLAALAMRGDCHALLALGCVIRGATPHFDYVAGQCAAGVQRIAVEHRVAVGFGVLTIDTIEQAIERAGTKAGNKGADAALAALETASVLLQIARD